MKEITSLKDTYRQSLTSQVNSREKIEALTKSNHDLKAELSIKMTINDQKFQEILKQRSKITELENEILELKNKLGKFRNSSFLLNEIIEVSENKRTQRKELVLLKFHHHFMVIIKLILLLQLKKM